MDEGAKRRLVGAAVLVALLVIFVPMLVDDGDRSDGLGDPIQVPGESEIDAAFDTEMPAVQALDQALGEGPTPPLPPPETHDNQVELPPPAEVEPLEPSAPRIPVELAAPPPPVQPTPARPAERPAPPSATAAGPKPVPAGATAWVVQVASLGSAAAAQDLQDDLRGQGFPAFVEQALVNGKTYYRVRVGPEVDRARADSVAARVQGFTSSKPLVQRYR